MTYFKPFKACVAEEALGLMCSYNSVNGVPACANKYLMTDVARRDWKFKGFFMSDAGAINFQVTAHKSSPNCTIATARSIKAGCNIELGNPSCYIKQNNALAQGFLSRDDIYENVKPLFYARMRMGEFDPPELNPYNLISVDVVLSPKHRQLAILAAQKSFVLLKNLNNVLPLTQSYNKVAIVGPLANNSKEFFGWPSSPVNKYTKTPWQTLQHLAVKSTTLAQGCDNNACKHYNRTEIKAGTTDADLVIICLGTGLSVESEGNDRHNLDLPGHQLDLLKDAVYYGSGARVILLLFTGGPVDITWAKLSNSVHSILACFYPAQGTGDALYNVLTNTGGADSVPAARSPYTWPAYIQQVPEMTDYHLSHGATYRYLKTDPLYPFGYGLSYTQFYYSNLHTVQILKNTFNVSVEVTNMGLIDADEVVQLYISWGNISKPVPNLQLAGFQRKLIKMGQTEIFQFQLSPESFKVWDTSKYIITSGMIDIFIGGQQPNQRTQTDSNILHTTVKVEQQTVPD